jgi:hypothetical protein
MLKERIKSISSKVASDLFIVQIKWSLWYIAVIVLLHIFVLFIVARGIFALSYGSTPVFMLILGIIAGNFLPFYVKQGVTRKDYYLGAALAALGLSFTIALIFSILSGIESALYSALNLGITIDPFNLQVSIEGSTNGVISLLTYALNVFTYYLIGWLVYLGFYRFRWVTGLGFCVLAFLIILFHGFIWNDEILTIFGTEGISEVLNLPIFSAIFGTIVLIVVLLCLIRLVMSRVSIEV